MATVYVHLSDDLYSYVNKEGSRLRKPMSAIIVDCINLYKDAREIVLKRTLNGE